MKRTLMIAAFGAVLAGCGSNPNAGTDRERATLGTGNGGREADANRAADVKSPYANDRVNRAGQAMAGDKKNAPQDSQQRQTSPAAGAPSQAQADHK
jgi:hypothetical protein